MRFVFIALCLTALTVSACASQKSASPPATKQQSIPDSTQAPGKNSAPSSQTATDVTPVSPKAVPTPAPQVTPVSGFPMSPSDAVKLIEPKQAAYVGGGWGRSRGDAVMFRRGNAYYNYIILEHFLIIARNRIFTTTEKGEDYVVLNDRLRFMRSSVEQNKKKYDYWQYTFIISKKTDVDRARKIVESAMKGEEKEKRLKEFTETFTQEFWFDVTEVFSLKSEELFKGLGKKTQ
ncbi:MAG: hypothetical protein FWG59_06805 [Betaproteobacteria bacterium]|nr:hypothetical protein [Betaproteobacteria bacterium]